MARAGRGAQAALVLVAALTAVSCAQGSGSLTTDAGSRSSTSEDGWNRERVGRPPVVEVLAGGGSLPLRDPDAAPSTALGWLRAQYLPVWTPDFDWAFPPEACGTAWELDGLAEPASHANIAALGDFATAAALAVMRYEHQLSRALADPTPLAQLCVATASVDPARSDVLNVLATHLRSGSHSSDPVAYPEEVVLVGASEMSVVAVACITPTDAQPLAQLNAYLLTVSRGLEDQVVDISYRVSDANYRSTDGCSGLRAWAAEWHSNVQRWIDEGRIWQRLDLTLTVDGICDSRPPDGPDECPRDWTS